MTNFTQKAPDFTHFKTNQLFFDILYTQAQGLASKGKGAMNKRYFRMVCKMENGEIKKSIWIDMEKRNIFDLITCYNLATNNYNAICNIEYKEVK